MFYVPSPRLSTMPAVADHIRKVGISMEGQLPNLTEFNQRQPLPEIIKRLCEGWSIPNPGDYSLRFDDEKTNRRSFITETTRGLIRNGDVLKLENSPERIAANILTVLGDRVAEKKVTALKQLRMYSHDVTFAGEFVKREGHLRLLHMAETQLDIASSLGDLLKSFVNIMDHGIVTWDVATEKLVKMMVGHVGQHKASVKDAVAVSAALNILEEIVLNSAGVQVEKDLNMTDLVVHLSNRDKRVQRSALAVINALLSRGDEAQKETIIQTVQQKHRRAVLEELACRVKTPGHGPAGAGEDIRHELYALQQHILNTLHTLLLRPVDPANDQGAAKQVSELLKIAFNVDGDNTASLRRQSSNRGDFKRLGFLNPVSPLEDFQGTPPGRLALDCMYYFATKHREAYSKLVLENSCRGDEHDCPFGRTSLELVTMLAELLGVGQPVQDEGTSYHPMLFTSEQPLHELYCVAIQLLCKTWKDMRATAQDFNKVMKVVKEQLTLALETRPVTFDTLKSRLHDLPYSEILKRWQEHQREREEMESNAKPIVELRNEIYPQIKELVARQRLNHLVTGTEFPCKTKGRNKQHMFCKLMANHKVLTYSDPYEHQNPANPASLCHKEVNVSSITDIWTGPRIEANNKKGKPGEKNNAFSIRYTVGEGGEPANLDLIAPTDVELHYWVDGISVLLNREPCSEKAVSDRDMLLSMETKIRLIETEGITIPDNPPPIPPLPPNYDFVYKDF